VRRALSTRVLRKLALVTCLGAVLVLPSSVAQAAEISFESESGSLDIKASPGEVNTATLDADFESGAHTVTFSDSTTPLTAPDCDVDAATATCEIQGLRAVKLGLGDQNDSLDAISDAAGIKVVVRLGAGADDATFGPEGRICEEVANLPSYVCEIYGDGGDDEIVMPDNVPEQNSFGWGGGGEDVLVGGSGFNILNGESGDDVYRGGPSQDYMGTAPDPGSDQLNGGAGGDNLRERAGSDVVRGGAGDDEMISIPEGPVAEDELRGGSGEDFYFRYCGRCQISLDGTANDGALNGKESDFVAAELFETARDVPRGNPGPYERLGDGADRLIGDRHDNYISGWEGPDLIVGRGGHDEMLGGPGDDVLKAADGQADRVRCGPGDDIAVLDRKDTGLGNCEDVRSRAGT
jgi:Ca2+-binding RTX toxin-like protein